MRCLRQLFLTLHEFQQSLQLTFDKLLFYSTASIRFSKWAVPFPFRPWSIFVQIVSEMNIFQSPFVFVKRSPVDNERFSQSYSHLRHLNV